MSRPDYRNDLQPGAAVFNGNLVGRICERLTGSRNGEPHFEIHVRYPDGSTSIHVNEERDALRRA